MILSDCEGEEAQSTLLECNAEWKKGVNFERKMLKLSVKMHYST